jgi:hypothetical protein
VTAWAKPRHELLLLALCAVAALGIANGFNVQDQSRWCLSDAIVHGTFTIDHCIGDAIDRSRYGGHLYSNKAPGMSLLGLPAAAAVRYTPNPSRHDEIGAKIWFVRLVACGLPFLLAVFLVGRVCEGIAPGTGGRSLVAFALGTPVVSYAIVGFDHLPAAAFGFAAFVLAWRRRYLLAGLAGGAALLCEYEAAAIVGIVGLYALLRGRRALLRYVAGVVPGAVLLAAYDWSAFGAPWHTPLAYSDNDYATVHNSGLLGVHLPNLHSAKLVSLVPNGLLLTSPVLLFAAVGLVLLWRRGLRAEAAVAALVAAVFLIAECGYGDPYGGYSSLPRYAIPALPFLAIGLAPAFQRLGLLTSLAAGASILVSMAIALVWAMEDRFPHNIWTLVARVPGGGRHGWIVSNLSPSAFGWIGVGTLTAAVVAWLLALASFGLAQFAARRVDPV